MITETKTGMMLPIQTVLEQALFDTLHTELGLVTPPQYTVIYPKLFHITRRGIQKACIVCEMLQYLQHLAHHRRTASVREVYYRLCHRVKTQHTLDTILRELCQKLKCSRLRLSLRVSEKGLVFGCLKLYHGNEVLDCAAHVSGRLISETFCEVGYNFQR